MKGILLIRTSESERIKSVLNRENIDYQLVYDDDLDKGLTQEEIYRRDMRLANQDPERQQEIKFWDKVQNQDNTKLNSNDNDDWDWK
jgi:hypothetical protein